VTKKRCQEQLGHAVPEFDILPRAGKYLAFQAIKQYLGQETDEIRALLAGKNLLLSLKI
jgi:hypothetical protein